MFDLSSAPHFDLGSYSGERRDFSGFSLLHDHLPPALPLALAPRSPSGLGGYLVSRASLRSPSNNLFRPLRPQGYLSA